LFFTNKGRVYRAKAYELPEAGRDAKGQHVANVLSLSGDEVVTQVLAIKDYDNAPFLVLATKQGMVKKTPLTEYNSNRSGGLIAINLREDDELISAQLVGDKDDLLLVSRKGYSVRFTAEDATLRPMGRATSGVIGMRFKTDDDHLLSMDVVQDGAFVVTATDGGFAKRTSVDEWNSKGRGTQGVRAMRLVEERGGLVGAMVAMEDDQIFAIASNGVVIRTSVSDIRATGRDTMGVRLMNLGDEDVLITIARSAERDDDEGEDGVEEVAAEGATDETPAEGEGASE
jgi:DNA gyrase subunit A